MGEIWEQKDFCYNLAIQNSKNESIEVLDFAVSCGCIESIEPRTLSIPAAESAIVRLKMDLTKRNREERGLVNRTFKVEIRPLLKSQVNPQLGWSIQGVIKSRVTLDTLYLDFGSEPIHGQTPMWRKVKGTVHVNETALRVKSNPDFVQVQDCLSEDGSRHFELMVAPRPDLPIGPFSCQLGIDLETKSGERLTGAILPVSGQMQPEVRAIPAQLAFGPRRIGQTAESTVTLQVPLGEKWAVESIQSDSDEVRIEVVADSRIATGQVFRIRQVVSKRGRQTSKILFFMRKGKDKPIPLAMEVSYEGDADGIVSENNPKGTGR